ncbi:helix-turn-helix transcriptional regulator [Streptomyces sp. NPDC005438]|uniref:helix-turn-helix domain-containing protein n=1 Tax=Streptomyces sp. NPDC005438 TaxID=3156880 RepID=UPI0033B8B858
MSNPRSGPTTALRVIAYELKARRQRAGLTVAMAAEALGVHTMTVTRLERAQTAPRRATVAHLMDVYGADPEERRQLLDALDRALEPGWWHSYRDVVPAHMDGLMDLESEANVIRAYCPTLVPELLRTPEYARALLEMDHPRADQEELERRGALLAARQRERRGRLWAVMDESALRRPVGGPKVLAEQLEALRRYVEEPGREGVTVQWIPIASAPHPLLLSGPVEVYRHPHPRIPDHLVLRGPHEQTVTDTADKVFTYTAAMDIVAARAQEPDTPLPV